MPAFGRPSLTENINLQPERVLCTSGRVFGHRNQDAHEEILAGAILSRGLLGVEVATSLSAADWSFSDFACGLKTRFRPQHDSLLNLTFGGTVC